MKKLLPKLIGTYLNGLAKISPTKAGKQGFALFCYPKRIPLKEHQLEFLNSAEKISKTYEGQQLQAYRWGCGPKKVLFLHGWQSHSFRWKNYIQALSPEEYTVYALDAPGHGLSEGKRLTVPLYSRVIRQFIEELGEVHTVVSHSIGSFSALHALYAAPELAVGRLVVMASPAAAHDFVSFYRATLQLSDRAVDHTLQHFEQAIGKPIHYFVAERFAATLTLPGLIIHDVEDLETPYTSALAIHKAWKQSRLMTTKGLAHNLRSPKVVEAVTAFINEPLPASAAVAGAATAASSGVVR